MVVLSSLLTQSRISHLSFAEKQKTKNTQRKLERKERTQKLSNLEVICNDDRLLLLMLVKPLARFQTFDVNEKKNRRIEER